MGRGSNQGQIDALCSNRDLRISPGYDQQHVYGSYQTFNEPGNRESFTSGVGSCRNDYDSGRSIKPVSNCVAAFYQQDTSVPNNAKIGTTSRPGRRQVADGSSRGECWEVGAKNSSTTSQNLPRERSQRKTELFECEKEERDEPLSTEQLQSNQRDRKKSRSTKRGECGGRNSVKGPTLPTDSTVGAARRSVEAEMMNVDSMEMTDDSEDDCLTEGSEERDTGIETLKLSSSVDHGAWYSLGKKKKPKVKMGASAEGLGDSKKKTASKSYDKTASEIGKPQQLPVHHDGAQREATPTQQSAVTSTQQTRKEGTLEPSSADKNLLQPPAKKKKKGWGSMLGLGKGSSKKKSKNASSATSSQSASGPISTTSTEKKKLHEERSGTWDDDDLVSEAGGYTDRSGRSGATASDVTGSAAETGKKKKKKGWVDTIMGTGTKSRKKVIEQLQQQRIFAEEKKIETPAVKPRPPDSHEMLQKMRQETRENLLHALSTIQQRFIASQLNQEEIRKQQAKADDAKRADVGPSKGLSTGEDLLGLKAALGGKDTTDLSFLCDLTQVDWSQVESQSQSDTIRTVFVLNKLRQLITNLFDDEGSQKSLKELEDAEFAQKERWVKEEEELGDLIKGRNMLDSLNKRVQCSEDFHRKEVYDQVDVLTKEINHLRDRLHKAISDGFDSWQAPCLEMSSASSFKMIKGGEQPSPYSENMESSQLANPFLMPGFLQRAIRLTDSLNEDVSADATVATQGNTSLALADKKKQQKEEIERALRNGLRNAGAVKKAPVSEGFLVVSSKDDFLMMEKKLDGKWGSYKVFERWLQEALKWQWLDFNLQKDFSERDVDLRQLAGDKKAEFLKALDVRLAQFWMGRTTEIRRSATLSLTDLLEESITARKPVYISPTASQVEGAKMAAEDQRSQLERFVYSKIGTKILKEVEKEKEKSPGAKAEQFQLKKADDLTKLIDDAKQVQYALLRDSSLIESLNVQKNFEKQREQVTKMASHLSDMAKENTEVEKKASKKKKELDAQQKEIAERLAKEKEKQASVEALRKEVKALWMDVTRLTKELETSTKKTESLKSAEKKLKEVKKEKAVAAARLERHLKEENKKYDKLLTTVEKDKTSEVKSKSSYMPSFFKGLAPKKTPSKSQISVAPASSEALELGTSEGVRTPTALSPTAVSPTAISPTAVSNYTESVAPSDDEVSVVKTPVHAATSPEPKVKRLGTAKSLEKKKKKPTMFQKLKKSFAKDSSSKKEKASSPAQTTAAEEKAISPAPSTAAAVTSNNAVTRVESNVYDSRRVNFGLEENMDESIAISQRTAATPSASPAKVGVQEKPGRETAVRPEMQTVTVSDARHYPEFVDPMFLEIENRQRSSFEPLPVLAPAKVEQRDLPPLPMPVRAQQEPPVSIPSSTHSAVVDAYGTATRSPSTPARSIPAAEVSLPSTTSVTPQALSPQKSMSHPSVSLNQNQNISENDIRELTPPSSSSAKAAIVNLPLNTDSSAFLVGFPTRTNRVSTPIETGPTPVHASTTTHKDSSKYAASSSGSRSESETQSLQSAGDTGKAKEKKKKKGFMSMFKKGKKSSSKSQKSETSEKHKTERKGSHDLPLTTTPPTTKAKRSQSTSNDKYDKLPSQKEVKASDGPVSHGYSPKKNGGYSPKKNEVEGKKFSSPDSSDQARRRSLSISIEKLRSQKEKSIKPSDVEGSSGQEKSGVETLDGKKYNSADFFDQPQLKSKSRSIEKLLSQDAKLAKPSDVVVSSGQEPKKSGVEYGVEGRKFNSADYNDQPQQKSKSPPIEKLPSQGRKSLSNRKPFDMDFSDLFRDEESEAKGAVSSTPTSSPKILKSPRADSVLSVTDLPPPLSATGSSGSSSPPKLAFPKSSFEGFLSGPAKPIVVAENETLPNFGSWREEEPYNRSIKDDPQISGVTRRISRSDSPPVLIHDLKSSMSSSSSIELPARIPSFPQPQRSSSAGLRQPSVDTSATAPFKIQVIPAHDDSSNDETRLARKREAQKTPEVSNAAQSRGGIEQPPLPSQSASWEYDDP